MKMNYISLKTKKGERKYNKSNNFFIDFLLKDIQYIYMYIYY
jgi:hypothetical protein